MSCLPMNQIIKSVFGHSGKTEKSATEQPQMAAPLEIIIKTTIQIESLAVVSMKSSSTNQPTTIKTPKGSPQDFRKETTSFPDLTASEIAHLREQAIAATIRGAHTPPPRNSSHSSRGHGRNGSYASTFASPSSRVRQGSLSVSMGSVSNSGGFSSSWNGSGTSAHGRNGSFASGYIPAAGQGSPRRLRHGSLY